MTDGKEMPKTYDFKTAEERLYRWWEENGWFKPEIAGQDAEPYVISIPPPNVTGALHQGHALFVAIEDLMIRHARMNGCAALWVPGTDHAGIATQLQVVRQLENEGTSRVAVGREEFLRRTWQWKAEHGGRIVEQVRRLGASCDWDRERFTLDDGLSRAVREAFVRWYEQGLIYRGTYMINWSPGLQTAVSDLEVERLEEQGKLYYFKYRIKGEDTYIPVATTRPETILGDTAVAVHPEDERYQAYVGKTALVPILGREIPVIADEYVDREFGTGALKITPAHDPNDYQIGQKHELEMINILNKDATLNENAGPYAGQDRFTAREKLWADMEAAGLTIKVEPYMHAVPRSQRGGELIEPMISTQWFADVSGPAAEALKAVKDGRLTIIPERFGKVWEHWLTDIQPWCISRQLWWGHRIPAWHCRECGHITVTREDPTQCASCSSTNIDQDPDVLDTWFSSGLWPFSTLGWPDETPDLCRYYPTTMMETGYDILFFWVARMVMMGLAFTGKVPFRYVYLHGLVRDEHGKKMSKSHGNVIDPIETMDEYGTDALRFTLLTGATPGNDLNLSMDRVAANRNFANKIWNAARFLVSNLDGETLTGTPARDELSLPDRWILSRLHRLIESVNRLFDSFLYGEAGRQIYDFLWGEYADWYIEISKIALYGEDTAAQSRTRHVLTYVLDQCLRMLHPFVPFVTEEIWQHIPHDGPALIIARWPETDEAFFNEQAETHMGLLMEIVKGIRNVRAEYNVPPARRIAAHISAGQWAGVLDQHRDVFTRLANVDGETLEIGTALSELPDRAASVTVSGATVYLPLADLVDLEAERARLAKEMTGIAQQIERTESLLASDGFTSRAPTDVVQRERDKLTSLRATHEAIRERLTTLA
ncbi:MAG: valine--tRNA ligase [Anaerolineae bacterium]|nr:valine--tRNA ligase [Anaerolineae bacterium]